MMMRFTNNTLDYMFLFRKDVETRLNYIGSVLEMSHKLVDNDNSRSVKYEEIVNSQFRQKHISF